MNKNGILVRLMLGAIFSALVVGFLGTQVLYRLSVMDQRELGQKTIVQLNQTVSSTSSIAVYVQDQELAREVINGLVTNDVIKHAAIRSAEFSVADEGFVESDNNIEFSIFSPFEPDRKLGSLAITPDNDFIEFLAKDIALNVLLITILLSIVTIVTVTVMVHLMITGPLVGIQKSLNKIHPGDKSRLLAPRFHRLSELGVLVSDTNLLLDKAELQIDQERELRNEIEAISERFQMIFERSVTGMVLTDERGTILLSNNAFDELLGRIGIEKKSSYGNFFNELFENPAKVDEVIRRALVNRETVTGEFKLQSYKAGKQIENIWVSMVFSINTTEDYRDYYQFTFIDISHGKQRMEELDRLAHYDQLTGIMNRQAAEVELQKLIDKRSPFSLILLDLNGFKPINDVYGHDAGDDILIHVAQAMKKSLRESDICARWGGDEFVIACQLKEKSDVAAIADTLIAAIKVPYFLAAYDTTVSVGASLGCVIYQEDDVDLMGLVKLADEAMYSQKSEKSLADNSVSVKFADEI